MLYKLKQLLQNEGPKNTLNYQFKDSTKTTANTTTIMRRELPHTEQKLELYSAQEVNLVYNLGQ